MRELLKHRCLPHFDSAIRARGQEYMDEGSVHILRATSQELVGLVQGNKAPYEVHLRWRQLGHTSILNSGCVCPYFERWGRCKHIWATILGASGGVFEEGLIGRNLEIREDSSLTSETNRDESLIRNFTRGQWREKLLGAALSSESMTRAQELSTHKKRLAWYALHLDVSEESGLATIHLHYQEENKKSGYGQSKPLAFTAKELPLFADPQDQKILAKLCASLPQNQGYAGVTKAQTVSSIQIHPRFFSEIFPDLVQTGRFVFTTHLEKTVEDAFAIRKWVGTPAELCMRVLNNEEDFGLESYVKFPDQAPGKEAEPWMLPNCGLTILEGSLYPLRRTKALTVIWELTESGDFLCPISEKDAFVEEYLKIAEPSSIDLPEEWGWAQVTPRLQPILRIGLPTQFGSESISIPAFVEFAYKIGDEVVTPNNNQTSLDAENKQIFKVNLKEQEDHLKELLNSHYVESVDPQSHQFQVAFSGLHHLVDHLSEKGWDIRAEKQGVVRSSQAKIEVVESRVDWFEVKGHVDFGGTRVEFPELLKQLSKNRNYVRLDNGRIGILPKEWLSTWAKLKDLSNNGANLEFSKDQSFILDLLLQQLEANPVRSLAFQRQLQNLATLTEPPVSHAAEQFHGELRHYQQEGLGWMELLGQAGVGGILADDMGLGKTVQVLALIQKTRRADQDKNLKPDLIIAPKSLVFNWTKELEKFTPELTALNYTGIKRDIRDISKYDVVLTTYGTLRRDILKLRELDFNFVVLDEAHAIKNSNSQSSKACRLLRARQRLALTGTPIENRMSELSSILQFLNPGLIGTKVQSVLSKDMRADEDGKDWRPLVIQAVRPFVLRRTKKAVLPELPERSDQVVYCQLSAAERKEYERLKEWYRASLSENIQSQGFEKSKMHVLEALLRLRQAACHRALLGGTPGNEELKSAKMELLFDMLGDLVQSHKVLIFSQFTTLLAQVQKEMKKREWQYCYLDGQTSAPKRQEQVERFQADENYRCFLLSLKAGGHGLNLTAAEYCFILDPWWNPAAEAQAIDRMHRIGQTKDVYSFRIISKDTVEEKILELQESKKNLADEFWNSSSTGLAQLSQQEIMELFT